MKVLHVLLLAAALPLSGCRPDEARAEVGTPERAPLPAKIERRTRVEVARLDPSAAALEFTFPGEVEGSRDAVLAAALGGLVEAVLVQPGDRVKKGQALVRVDSSIHEVRVEQATADAQQAKADADRVEAMGEAASRAQRDGAQTRLRISEAGLRLAQAQLSRSIIRAPFDGVVALLNPEVGEVVAPGATAVRVVQLAPVKVSVSVGDRDVGALAKGMAVRVTTDAEATVHEGKISFVSPASDLRTRAFRVEVEVPNLDARLLPGMIARVRVFSQGADKALVLPQHVLVTRRDEVGVFVDAEGRARWRALKVGQVVGSQVVVAEGLSGGERVVVTGHRELADGDPLEIAREGFCCTRGRVVHAAAAGASR